MNMAFVKYTAQEGDTFSTIAHKAYGDASAFPDVIDANGGIPISTTIPEGTIIYVPIKANTIQNLSNNAAIPPWKR